MGRGPLLAPWDYCAGQHADRRLGVQVGELHGEGGGGRWHIGTWDTSGQQLTTMQLIMPPIVLSVGGGG